MTTTVLVAAHDAPDSVRAIADFVCDGVNDEYELRAAAQAASELTNGRIEFSEGTYNLRQGTKENNEGEQRRSDLHIDYGTFYALIRQWSGTITPEESRILIDAALPEPCEHGNYARHIVAPSFRGGGISTRDGDMWCDGKPV